MARELTDLLRLGVKIKILALIADLSDLNLSSVHEIVKTDNHVRGFIDDPLLFRSARHITYMTASRNLRPECQSLFLEAFDVIEESEILSILCDIASIASLIGR